jgi:hypothetical protein
MYEATVDVLTASLLGNTRYGGGDCLDFGPCDEFFFSSSTSRLFFFFRPYLMYSIAPFG